MEKKIAEPWNLTFLINLLSPVEAGFRACSPCVKHGMNSAVENYF